MSNEKKKRKKEEEGILKYKKANALFNMVILIKQIVRTSAEEGGKLY